MNVDSQKVSEYFGVRIPQSCPKTMQLMRRSFLPVDHLRIHTYAQEQRGIIEVRMPTFAVTTNSKNMVNASIVRFDIGNAGVNTLKEAGIGEITFGTISEETSRRTISLLSNNWNIIQQAARAQRTMPTGIMSFLGMHDGDPIGPLMEYYNKLFSTELSGAAGISISSYENKPIPSFRNRDLPERFQTEIKPGDDDFTGSLNPASPYVKDLFRSLGLATLEPWQLDPKCTIIDVTSLWLYNNGIFPIQRLHIPIEIINAERISG